MIINYSKANKIRQAIQIIFLLTMIILLLSSATTDKVQKVENINASKETAYFNLKQGEQVSQAQNWDIAFNRTTIYINNEGVLLNKPFEDINSIPEVEFKKDSEKEKAIPTGSGNGWYKYNMFNHSITPIENKTILVKTEKEKKYVKLAIENYYNSENLESGYYSFRYAFLD